MIAATSTDPVGTRDLPERTYITLNDHGPGRWQGYAHICRVHVPTREEFAAVHPEITAEPHELTPDDGQAYWIASWQDRAWHDTPEAALAAITALVCADVKVGAGS